MRTAPSIGVIDYGMGNLRSVLNALDEVGAQGDLVSDPERLAEYDKLVLPGVGAFADAAAALHADGLDEALLEQARSGKSLLGICLGMQLVCETSLEDGEHSGLGLLPAVVRRFPDRDGLKVPHIGWNAIEWCCEHWLTREVAGGSDVYFVHSYFVDCADNGAVLAETEHGVRFTSAVARDNVLGLQFHPEKSQRPGLQLLANFAAGPC